MALFDWLRKKSSHQRSPEGGWVVMLRDAAFEVTTPKGEVERLPVGDLSAVSVRTSDKGPWDADVWWLLFGRDHKVACSFPQGATGEQLAVDYLMKLPAFDYDAMIDAMSSTGNAVFPLWRSGGPLNEP